MLFFFYPSPSQFACQCAARSAPQWKSAASRRRVKKLFHRNKGLEVSTEHKIPMEWSFFFFLQIIKTKNEQEKYVLARGKKGMRMRGSQENSSWRWNYFVVVDCNAELMNLQREHFYSICFSFLSFWGTKKKLASQLCARAPSIQFHSLTNVAKTSDDLFHLTKFNRKFQLIQYHFECWPGSGAGPMLRRTHMRRNSTKPNINPSNNRVDKRCRMDFSRNQLVRNSRKSSVVN